VLELVGIRRFNRAFAVVSGETVLPALGIESLPGWDETTLQELREKNRYFGWANLIRGALYLPVLWALAQYQAWWIFGLLAVLVAFHFACLLLEIYKFHRSILLRPSEERLVQSRVAVEWNPSPNPSLGDRYFRPRRFETPEFYRAVGMELVRKIVTTYIDHTRLTTEERRAKKVHYVEGNLRDGLPQFEYNTRVGEAMHLSAAAFNVPPLLFFLWSGPWVWALYPGAILFADLALAILQRYHRARAWSILRRIGGKPGSGTPQSIESRVSAL